MRIDRIENETNITDAQIRAAAEFATPSPDIHIPIVRVFYQQGNAARSFLLKQHGHSFIETMRIESGDRPWGNYVWADRSLNIFVPDDVSGREFHTPHLHLTGTFNTMQEWLIHVMGHELRHAEQHQIKYVARGLPDWMVPAMEEDAERYGVNQHMKWREMDSTL